jgi:2-methylcitrate dehydratase PrpD
MTSSTQADANEQLSAYLSSTGFEDLPPQAIAATKRNIFDTVGVMLAGGGPHATARRIVEMLSRWGGEPSSTVIGHEIRLPSVAAAFANTAMAHQFDFDDTHDEAVAHPTPGTLSAALAVAEEEGGVSGRDLLRAVALGDDIVCRVGLAANGSLYDYPWLWPAIVGIWGATAGAGTILRLSPQEQEAAFGLTLHQVGTTLQCQFSPGSDVRGLRDGFAARNGVTAAHMAKLGIRGDKDAFDGRFGFYGAFFGGNYDRSRLVDRLGKHFEVDRITIKPWPSARETHATLEALLQLREQNAVDPDEIETVLVRVGGTNLQLCEPADQRRRPTVRMDALCSLPFASGVALAYGEVRLSSFTEEGMRDPKVLSLVDRVTWEVDQQRSEDETIEGGDVELRLRDGRVLKNTVRHASGHPDQPLSDEIVIRKFLNCAAMSKRPPDEGDVRKFWDVVQNLENVSVTDFSAALRDLSGTPEDGTV